MRCATKSARPPSDAPTGCIFGRFALRPGLRSRAERVFVFGLGMMGLPATEGKSYAAAPRRTKRVCDGVDASITAEKATFRVGGLATLSL